MNVDALFLLLKLYLIIKHLIFLQLMVLKLIKKSLLVPILKFKMAIFFQLVLFLKELLFVILKNSMATAEKLQKVLVLLHYFIVKLPQVLLFVYVLEKVLLFNKTAVLLLVQWLLLDLKKNHS